MAVLSFFSLLLCEEGHLDSNWCLYTANSNYELGRGDTVGGWKPKPIPSLHDVRIIQIAGGGYHSLALTGKLTTEIYLAPISV